jgi:hypothetical protein
MVVFGGWAVDGGAWYYLPHGYFTLLGMDIATKNPFLIIWTLAIAFSCLVETTINYQYGALLHVWPLLVCWQATKKLSN